MNLSIKHTLSKYQKFEDLISQDARLLLTSLASLSVAVLEVAFRDFINAKGDSLVKGEDHTYRRVYNWFYSKDELSEKGLSFDLACNFLGLERDLIERYILDRISGAESLEELSQVDRDCLSNYMNRR